MMILSNLIASAPDDRDYPYTLIDQRFIRSHVDLRPQAGAIEDQKTLGSCSANATVSACELLTGSRLDYSRLYNFYRARELEGHMAQGVETLRSNLKMGQKWGIPPESVWPYDLWRESLRPNSHVDGLAAQTKLGRYERIDMNVSPMARQAQCLDAIRSALSEGCPVMVATWIGHKLPYIKGPLAQQGYFPVAPQGQANSSMGAHAMLVVGYTPDFLILENSWGAEWGDKGYLAFPNACMADVFEAWVIRGFADQHRDDHGWVLRNPDTAAAAVMDMMAQNKVQAVIDACVRYGVDDWQLEKLMGWGEGAVKAYRAGEGAGMNWDGFLWA